VTFAGVESTGLLGLLSLPRLLTRKRRLEIELYDNREAGCGESPALLEELNGLQARADRCVELLKEGSKRYGGLRGR
jgi:hypothetical protein